MTKKRLLVILAGLAFAAALLTNLIISNEGFTSGIVAESLGGALVYFAVSAIPLAFQRERVTVWPSVAILIVIAALSAFGRMSA